MNNPHTAWLKEKYKINYLYHITHADNLFHILKHGLLCHTRAHESYLVLKDIADENVIEIRKWKRDTIAYRLITAYVPLFFTPKTPMLYRRIEMQDQIAILCLDSNLLFRKGVLFTDGNAANSETRFFDNIEFIDELDWDCIRASYWHEFEDGRRKRAAKVLVPNSIPFSDIQRIVLRTKEVEQSLHSKLRIKTEVDPRWYFDN